MLQLFSFFPYLLLPLLVFSIFLIESNGHENEIFVNCPTGWCGKQEVKYPFWVKSKTANDHTPHCGYQVFGLDCDDQRDGGLYLSLGDDYFYVKNISYTEKTVTLVDSEVKQNPKCPRARHNLTLDGLPLFYNRTDLNLAFYFNCTHALPFWNSSLPIRPIDCLNSGGNISYVSLEMSNQTDPYLSWSCEEIVVVPVNDEGYYSVLYKQISFGEAMNEGFVLDWGAEKDCSSCENSRGRCGSKVEEEDKTQFLCFCNDGSSTTDACNKGVVPAALVFLLWISIFLFKRKRNACFRLFLCRKKTKEDVNLETFIRQYGMIAPKRFSFSDIKKMTMSFKDKLGEGGYGTVYKGKLPGDLLVAVKILKTAQGDGEEFINEVLSICRTSHVNVVTFLGFCLEGKRRALVYEYMPNGSLEKFVHSSKNSISCNQLGMDKLHQISLGVARGLEYLHQGCNTRILHFDIKPHNILLDEDFCPKISDFGLAKQCKNKDSIVSIVDIRGTIGYIAPELVCRSFGGVSYKSDVYSYGMMILEIVGRRKNVSSETSHSSEVYFPHWAYQHLVVDNDLRLKGVVTPEEDEIARKIILVGLWCIQNDPSVRPAMSKVIEMLEGDLQAIPMPPKAFFGSPSTTPQSSSITATLVL